MSKQRNHARSEEAGIESKGQDEARSAETGATATCATTTAAARESAPVHGPKTWPGAALSGVERLRKCLAVSPEVAVDRLCEDAAGEIERLRAGQRSQPDWKDDLP